MANMKCRFLIYIGLIVFALILLVGCNGTKVNISGNSFNDMPDISIQKTFIMPKATTHEEERIVEDNYPIIPVEQENLDK